MRRSLSVSSSQLQGHSMTISMYQASMPVFQRALGNLRHVLEKGEAFAAEKEIAPEVLLQQHLIVDMLPLVRNVQIACDLAKNGACRRRTSSCRWRSPAGRCWCRLGTPARPR